MKENLRLSPGHEGAVWHCSNRGPLPRNSHRHDELELNLVLTGTARYLVGQRRYDLNRRTMIWLFPEQDHLLLDASRDYSMWILVISPDLLRRTCRDTAGRTLLQGDPGKVFSRTMGTATSARLAALFEEIGAAGNDVDRINAGVAYAVLAAWSAFEASDAATIALHVHPAVKEAARLLRDEQEQVKAEVLARQCGLSRSRLSRLFKQQTGISLLEYRQRQCLRRFLDLWADHGKTTMLEASLSAGFGSYPQFHRVFKRFMQKTPAQFRQPAQAITA